MSKRLGLFEGYGIELEYAVVDAASLDVRPYTDRVLSQVAGRIVSDVEWGRTAWSNELVAHQIEIKTNGPVSSLVGVERDFQEAVLAIDGILAASGARLLPGAMHPWMDPTRETVLWQHEYHEIYASYDRIFGCKAHGWANVQSMHLNLPFADDGEFERLHAAVRLVLPLLPGLAAASPYCDGRRAGWLDERLRYYREHSARVPSMTGAVIPEPVWNRADYEREILRPIWGELSPLDPEGLLSYEFANARGAIARFDRDAIEIRLIDSQECPAMDLAIAAAVAAVVRTLVSERWSTLARQKAVDGAPLAALLWRAAEQAEQAVVEERELLECLGWKAARRPRLSELWAVLLEECGFRAPEMPAVWREALGTILAEGPLARRLVRRLGERPGRAELERVWRELCDGLRAGKSFHAPA